MPIKALRRYLRKPVEPNLYKAFEVWYSFYHTDICDWNADDKATFAKFLGGFEGNIGILAGWKLTDAAETKVHMLLGPHARTVVKIYFIRHPELPKPPLL